MTDRIVYTALFERRVDGCVPRSTWRVRRLGAVAYRDPDYGRFVIALLLVTGATVVWALTHRRLRRFAVSGPLLMTFLGAGAGWFVVGESVLFFDSEAALHVAEVILALLLFVDAVDVKGPPRAVLTAVPLRLLLIAVPLSLACILAVGLALPLGLSVPVVVAIACIATPVDFAPDMSIVRDTRIPARVRRWLSIESGYNDGLVAPVFLAALALAAESARPGDDALEAFLTAAPAGLIAVVVGAVLGVVAGRLFRLARSAGWADGQSIRIGLLALPVLTFAAAVPVGGNGFVAAFVCGIAFRLARGRGWDDHSELSLVEDVTSFLTLLLWFTFGIAAIILVTGYRDWWPAFFLAFFALTVGRIVPVLIALLGTRATRKERLVIALLGPRGAASIVFALIAVNALSFEEGLDVLAATSFVIVGSLLLHGIGGPLLIRRLYGDSDHSMRKTPSSPTSS
ncbi:sodium:proton antiporter [Rathayibacter rathayi]|uniref:cation:proton antiporter domain-containing protein n=1 Tax=Rathayibacter rathayi TaxID=33887 RepID=UPI000CE7D2D3|nr:cation:proton antiporter [Rathayibacter rathayi]PPG68413.1 sodium:proton antiporter [Rathayibacter rathayi]PPG74981.1 sodium:proton antiporter [Rathayibacter rathayi]PPG88779.1 sodium:proton antiporter [Rathayibacter rathayi]PPG95245.1 sodium:proton antiporter [Rathayibacter rathayi]PPH20652.1 sodium:proton antiporter [Rathayibacter rathayi]